jgi:rhamnogalacturonyl hydrolase YesR
MRGEFDEPVFWARGSGWVFAGLVRTMEYIDGEHPDRAFYDKLYREMADKLVSLQREDGTWSMSLLAQEKIKAIEMSGTAFFVYGLAWGINQGLLDHEKYWPAVAKGWHALNSSIHPSGKLGWVQGIGAAPGEVSYDDSQIYAVGAFMLSGSMIYDMAKARNQ